MNAIRNHFLCAFAAALLAGCGGGDPDAPVAAEPDASTASYQRGDAGAMESAISRDQPPGAVLAGAATTQDAIDRALAANAAAAAIDTQR